MTEFLKDKFSSRPATDNYRKGWDKTFSPRPATTDQDDNWICLECGKGCLGGHNCAHCGAKKE